MRALPLACVLLLVAAGCDSADDGIAPLDDVLIVDLVEGLVPAVQFTTEGTPGCYVPIAHRTRVAGSALTVEVDGLEFPTGPACRAITSSSFSVALPMGRPGDLRLAVRHRGETDVYVVRPNFLGRFLDPVRTSVTRPGPR